jgi:hypothetical protein
MKLDMIRRLQDKPKVIDPKHCLGFQQRYDVCELRANPAGLAFLRLPMAAANYWKVELTPSTPRYMVSSEDIGINCQLYAIVESKLLFQ